MKKVSVVVLNYKLKEQTLRCVNSVLKASYQIKDMVIVDNGDKSEIDDVDIKDVKIIKTGSNLGYSGGNNRGIKFCLENGADFVFILNPDTVVERRCIEYLVRSATEEVGIVGPKILFEDKKTIWYSGGILDLSNVLGRHKGVDEEDKGQYDELTETDFVSGAAMFISRRVFEKVGFFDERYFLYYEDSDLCYRAKKNGFKIIYNPQAIVYHKNAQSTGLGSPIQDYYITRNRMLFARKFLPLRTQFALLREAAKNIGIPRRRKALIDFLLGRFGKEGE